MPRITKGAVGLILSSVAGSSLMAAPIEWQVSAGGNGHFYEAVLVTTGIDWQSAATASTNAGGYLASITSAAENNFVYSLVSGSDAFWFIDSVGNGIGPWIGGYQVVGSGEPVGQWAWHSGEPFAYTNWSFDNPSNSQWSGLPTDENRIGFYAFGTLKGPEWNDYPVGADMVRGYVVEYVPEPSSILAIAGIVAVMGTRRARRD